MKVVILAGGYGTRLGEETENVPKPLIEIGGKPILWHIMKIYSHYGFNDFIICLGYKGNLIKEFFHHQYLYSSNLTIDLANNQIDYIQNQVEPWKVHLIDTGLKTMTGGRIKRLKKYLAGESFMLTYGDGVGDINIPGLIKYHQTQKKIVTLTSVQPLGRYGAILFGKDTNRVLKFQEKPKGDNSWINGGFYVFEPEIFNYIASDKTHLELEPLERLAQKNQISAYRHTGFWKSMDTLRDKIELENLWEKKKALWKIWKN